MQVWSKISHHKTNHRLRATGTSVLYQVGVPEKVHRVVCITMNVLLMISIALHLGFCLLFSMQLMIRKFHSKLHVARLLCLQFHIQGYSFSLSYLRSRLHLLQLWCYYAYSSRLPLQRIALPQQAPTMNFSGCSIMIYQGTNTAQPPSSCSCK